MLSFSQLYLQSSGFLEIIIQSYPCISIFIHSGLQKQTFAWWKTTVSVFHILRGHALFSWNRGISSPSCIMSRWVMPQLQVLNIFSLGSKQTIQITTVSGVSPLGTSQTLPSQQKLISVGLKCMDHRVKLQSPWGQEAQFLHLSSSLCSGSTNTYSFTIYFTVYKKLTALTK